MSFRAKYPGRCTSCDSDIEVGDILEWNGDETAAVHLACAQESATSLKPRGICPRCFIELPTTGVCGVCDPEDGAA